MFSNRKISKNYGVCIRPLLLILTIYCLVTTSGLQTVLERSRQGQRNGDDRLKWERFLFQSNAHNKHMALYSSGSTDDVSFQKQKEQEHNDQLKRENVVTGVTLKIALDQTGGVADLSEQKSERFTCPESLDMVHRLRSVSDAVLVGKRTVAVDNPSLTVRRPTVVASCKKQQQQPLRVVLDSKLSLILQDIEDDKHHYTLFSDGLPTVVYHCVPDVDDTILDLDDAVTIVYLTPTASLDKSGDQQDEKLSNEILHLALRNIMDHLNSYFNAKHVMVEGGPQTALGFLKEGLVDRAILVRAPLSFRQPLPSGLTNDILHQAGLECKGRGNLGVDSVEYWARPAISWPTETFTDWP